MIVSIRNLFFASFLMVAGVASAKTKDVDIRLLSNGMKAFDVLNAIGAPLEKQELEVKREELWIYKNIELHFKEGVLHLPEMKSSGAKTETVAEPKEELSVEEEKHNSLEDWGAVMPVDDKVGLQDILQGLTKYIDDGKNKKDQGNKSRVKKFGR